MCVPKPKTLLGRKEADRVSTTDYSGQSSRRNTASSTKSTQCHICATDDLLFHTRPCNVTLHSKHQRGWQKLHDWALADEAKNGGGVDSARLDIDGPTGQWRIDCN